MQRRGSGHVRAPRLLPALAVTAYALVGAWWIWNYRHGQPLDVDEAGSMTIALSDRHALLGGGPVAWVQAVGAPRVQAPLMTAITTPVLLVTGPSSFTPLVVPLLLGCVLLAASYALGRAVAGPTGAWIALALTAGTPVVLAYARSYNLAIAAGATSALMLLAITRSERLRLRAWSLAAGVLLGLVLLSRTMVVAFMPALAVVLVLAVVRGPDRVRRLVNAVLLLLAAAVVAGPWYVGHGRAVYAYLTDYGYGAASGPKHSALSPAAWAAGLRYVLGEASLPVVLIWCVAAVVLVVLAVPACRERGARAVLDSPVLPSVLWSGWGLVALTSTSNKGTGFLVPLVPALSVVAAFVVAHCPRRAQRVLVGTVTVVAALGVVLSKDPRAAWAQPLRVDAPALGTTTLLSGQGAIQTYVASGGGDLTPGEGRDWRRANRDLAARIDRSHAAVLFGFRHRLVNPNTVLVESLARGSVGNPAGWIDATEVPNDASAMRAWLGGAGASDCLLLTAPGRSYEITPVVDAQLLGDQAEATGFTSVGRIALPDGRSVVIWSRDATCPPGAVERFLSPTSGS